MINRLQNGDYLPDGAGGFVRLTGIQEALQTALFRLQCRRGSFPFLPELGSNLYLLGTVPRSKQEVLAKQYCVQALQGSGVSVTQVAVAEDAQGVVMVTVDLLYEGEQGSLEVTVR